MRGTFCFPKLEEAALFASTHDTDIVFRETIARFEVFFVTVRPLPKIVKFHERIAATA